MTNPFNPVLRRSVSSTHRNPGLLDVNVHATAQVSIAIRGIVTATVMLVLIGFSNTGSGVRRLPPDTQLVGPVSDKPTTPDHFRVDVPPNVKIGSLGIEKFGTTAVHPVQ